MHSVPLTLCFPVNKRTRRVKKWKLLRGSIGPSSMYVCIVWESGLNFSFRTKPEFNQYEWRNTPKQNDKNTETRISKAYIQHLLRKESVNGICLYWFGRIHDMHVYVCGYVVSRMATMANIWSTRITYVSAYLSPNPSMSVISGMSMYIQCIYVCVRFVFQV